MTSYLILDPTMQQALTPLAHKAPNGFATLATLGDDLLMQVLTHPDDTKIVTRTNFLVDLPEVDQGGYTVYDRTFTQIYKIVIDPLAPLLDITQQFTRVMRFGASLLDFDFMQSRQHGEVFYIGYTSNLKLPHIVMMIVVDPTVQ